MSMAFLPQCTIIFWHAAQRHALAHIALAVRRSPLNLLHMIIRFAQFGRDLRLSCRHGDTGGRGDDRRPWFDVGPPTGALSKSMTSYERMHGYVGLKPTWKANLCFLLLTAVIVSGSILVLFAKCSHVGASLGGTCASLHLQSPRSP
jgi:hypothetical protein